MIPSGVTRVIWAIAPNEGVREAMMGDFAEEFALRAERDGVAAARLWSWRQAITSLVDTLRHTVPSFAIVATSVSRAVVWGWLISMLTLLAFYAATLPITATLARVLPEATAVMLMLALATLPVAVIAGYEAARIGSRAPLWSAVAFCTLIVSLNVLSMLGFALGVATPPGSTPWLGRLFLVPLTVPAVLVGAVLQQAQHRRLAAEGFVVR